MRHLGIGQRQKAPNFSAFHWSPYGCLITIGQHFVTRRVDHLPKRTETSLITESDQSRAYHRLLQLCTVRTEWSDSDQAVRTVHSCNSWLVIIIKLNASSNNDKLGHVRSFPGLRHLITFLKTVLNSFTSLSSAVK